MVSQHLQESLLIILYHVEGCEYILVGIHMIIHYRYSHFNGYSPHTKLKPLQ